MGSRRHAARTRAAWDSLRGGTQVPRAARAEVRPSLDVPEPPSATMCSCSGLPTSREKSQAPEHRTTLGQLRREVQVARGILSGCVDAATRVLPCHSAPQEGSGNGRLPRDLAREPRCGRLCPKSKASGSRSPLPSNPPAPPSRHPTVTRSSIPAG